MPHPFAYTGLQSRQKGEHHVWNPFKTWNHRPQRKRAQPKAVEKEQSGADGKYTVKSGDNLSTIAQQNGVSLADLKSANAHLQRGENNFNLIYPGDKVSLPKADANNAVATANKAATFETAKNAGQNAGQAQNGLTATNKKLETNEKLAASSEGKLKRAPNTWGRFFEDLPQHTNTNPKDMSKIRNIRGESKDTSTSTMTSSMDWIHKSDMSKIRNIRGASKDTSTSTMTSSMDWIHKSDMSKIRNIRGDSVDPSHQKLADLGASLTATRASIQGNRADALKEAGQLDKAIDLKGAAAQKAGEIGVQAGQIDAKDLGYGDMAKDIALNGIDMQKGMGKLMDAQTARIDYVQANK
ncbi:MAG: LysM peptidoglycan-binding domain-containing protein [Deltaproteobacteria bacterium]|nr:LysM peptidoglycan-binding domain-containing protein [Deltaproteobacteria bacterium]